MNPSKSFKDLSEEECFKIFKAMLENSDSKWKSSELLAADNDFGGAISYHIISIEELIKAMILCFDANGFEFRKVDGMNNILNRSHNLRHFIAFVMLAVNVISDDLKVFMKKIKENPALITKIKEDASQFQQAMSLYLLKKTIKIKAEFYWFKKVELLRQTGSHVDYKNNEIVSPMNIPVKDYLGVHDRLSKVRYVCKGLLESFDDSDDSQKKQLRIFKKLFLKFDWYKFIGLALQKVDNRSKNPFDIFLKQIDNPNSGDFITELKKEIRSKTSLKKPK